MLRRAFAWALLASAIACGPHPASPGGTAPKSANRIVVLVPSFVEDLFAVGAGGQVVGVSQATDWPPQARRLPQISSYASLDAERIVEVRPDLVVGIPAQAALVAPLRRAGVRVVLLPDDSYDDIFADLRALGTLSGHAAEARALIARLHTQVAQITARVPRGLQPRVFIVLGVDPIFTAGGHSYIDRLIAFAGGRNVAANLHVAYSRYSAEALVAAQPDVLIADSESGLGAVLSRPPWSLLRAVRRGRVAILRDPDLLDRPSPRFVDGLRWLVAKLHPVVPARRWPIAGVGADGVAP